MASNLYCLNCKQQHGSNDIYIMPAGIGEYMVQCRKCGCSKVYPAEQIPSQPLGPIESPTPKLPSRGEWLYDISGSLDEAGRNLVTISIETSGVARLVEIGVLDINEARIIFGFAPRT